VYSSLLELPHRRLPYDFVRALGAALLLPPSLLHHWYLKKDIILLRNSRRPFEHRIVWHWLWGQFKFTLLIFGRVLQLDVTDRRWLFQVHVHVVDPLLSVGLAGALRGC